MNPVSVLFFVIVVSAVNANPAIKEDICSGVLKDLAICKMRDLVDQAVKETEQILIEYPELLARGNLFELNPRPLEQNPAAVSNQKLAFEKRKSAFVRFGKRSDEASLNSEVSRSADLPSASLNSDSLTASLNNDHQFASFDKYSETSDINKRKSSYVRFGKRGM